MYELYKIYIHTSTRTCYRFSQHNLLYTFMPALYVWTFILRNYKGYLSQENGAFPMYLTYKEGHVSKEKGKKETHRQSQFYYVILFHIFLLAVLWVMKFWVRCSLSVFFIEFRVFRRSALKFSETFWKWTAVFIFDWDNCNISMYFFIKCRIILKFSVPCRY
jgi:hypothetical protein